MSPSSYPLLAKEGRVHLAIALAVGIFSTFVLDWWSVPIWLAVLFVFQFFRDPKRTIPQQNGVVVSPASGKVVSIAEVPNPYAEDSLYVKVSVFMNVFSVHSNLIPVSGTVCGKWYVPGSFFNAALDKSSADNERSAIRIRTKEGNDVFCVQIAGLLARRIFCYVEKDEEVEAGQRYGFIRFGSRVDVFIPKESRVVVRLGQWVDSGNDPIGYLPGRAMDPDTEGGILTGFRSGERR